MGITVCIPTIPSRSSTLSRALFVLDQQPLEHYGVEVLIHAGPEPMGDKLNEMFHYASGSHVVCLDDDDYLSNDYVRSLYKASLGHFGYNTVEFQYDFIGYDIVWMEDGRYQGLVSHSADGDTSWAGLKRGVSPKCLVRTELARSVPFGNDYHADQAWSAAIHSRIQHPCYLPEAHYYYDHWNKHMVGTAPDSPWFHQDQRDIGAWPYNEENFTWL